MKYVATILLSLSWTAFVSCQSTHPASTGADPVSSTFVPKSSSDLIAHIGVPAEVFITLPAGPYFNPARVMSYYTEDNSGIMRRQDYSFVDDRLIGGASFSSEERIVPATSQQNIRKILAYKDRQAQGRN